jgi:hypothetical protein
MPELHWLIGFQRTILYCCQPLMPHSFGHLAETRRTQTCIQSKEASLSFAQPISALGRQPAAKYAESIKRV